MPKYTVYSVVLKERYSSTGAATGRNILVVVPLDGTNVQPAVYLNDAEAQQYAAKMRTMYPNETYEVMPSTVYSDSVLLDVESHPKEPAQDTAGNLTGGD